MRIIAGEFRGRSIEAPPGRSTRPMLDRVREAIFSTLTPWLPEAHVLDLFAGSGSLSLEALSRGARRARPIERDPKAFSVLRENVANLGLEERTMALCGDALDPEVWGEEGADIAFLDPPYPWLRSEKERGALLDVIRRLLDGGLAPEGVIVFHAPRRAIAATYFGAGVEVAERIYGSNSIWYVQRGEKPGPTDASDDD